MVAALDAHQQALYPDACNHLTPLEHFTGEEGALFGLHDEAGVLRGIAGVLYRTGYGELKRVYVDPAARGRGIAYVLVRHIEAHVRQRGCRLVCLETGVRQKAALRIYERLGYTLCPPFGDYGPAALSVYMHKQLTP